MENNETNNNEINENEKKENIANIKFWKGALCGALAMFLIVGISLLTVNIAGVDVANIGRKNASGKSEVAAKLNLLNSIVDQYFLYTDDLEDQELKDGIYSGFVEALGDPYSVYYDEEGTKKFRESTAGEYCGIGVVLSQNIESKIMTITQVYENSPAKEAGMKEGDILYKVDGEDISGQDANEVVRKIRGEENTEVEITVLRGETLDEVVVRPERQKIQVETVVSEMKDDQIGYIRITEFDSVTSDQFETALNQLEGEGMQGLVVDLRNNPGGNLQVVCDILDLLLPKGIIVYTEDKYEQRNVIESDEEHQFEKPIAVLMNGNSASAAEIFAGAIQDYQLGPIVGTTSFGKGIVQQVIDVGDGTSLTLTIAEYFTPNGRNIHKIGIEPDVKVPYERNTDDPDADNQLDAAIGEVKTALGE